MPAPLSREEREPLIVEYERGAGRLREAWDKTPDAARQWHEASGKWSPHEVVVHCADSETYAATRIRLLVAESDPVIIGYDQDRWAQVFNYHSRSAELALQAVAAVRANTAAILRTLSEDDWSKMGRHTESGPYGSCDWLKSYAAHVTNHAKQIERSIAAWRANVGH